MTTLSEQLLHRIRDAHKRRKLTWWERTYLPAIAQGLLLTSQHFWRNLFLHLAHRLGLFRHVPASVTIQYPDEMRRTAPRLRTRHRLTKRADGTPRCVGCMMCETVCPARCIYIVAGEHPDPNVEKYPRSFDIDLGKCVYCGYCVEACPEDAIRMDTQRHDIAAYSRDGMWLDIKELLNPGTRAFNGSPEKFVQLDITDFAKLTPTPPPPPPGTGAPRPLDPGPGFSRGALAQPFDSRSGPSPERSRGTRDVAPDESRGRPERAQRVVVRLPSVAHHDPARPGCCQRRAGERGRRPSRRIEGRRQWSPGLAGGAPQAP